MHRSKLDIIQIWPYIIVFNIYVCYIGRQYHVHVFTGDVFKAGTDANIFVTLYGENGDSGERELLKSETNMNQFERGQVRFYENRQTTKWNGSFCQPQFLFHRV